MGINKPKQDIERIDTNVLIRLIVRDDPAALGRAKSLLSRENKLYIFEDAAMMEVVYVLSSSTYQYSREIIAEKIKGIMYLPNIVFNKSIISGALDLYVAHPKLSFVDCYLATTAEVSQETPLWTFDKKLAAQCIAAKIIS